MPLEHKHFILKAKIADPPFSTEEIDKWILSLVDKIGMKILSGPHTTYCDKLGNRGMTTVATIETSHIAMHCWDEEWPAAMQLDIYTCSSLDLHVVSEHLSIFKPQAESWICIDRSAEQLILESSNNILVNKGGA